MRGQLAFLKKEFLEILQTYKIYVIPAIFLLIGFTSPLLAKLTPEMLKMVNTGGMVIKLPAPTALDAYAQLFKNMNQICFLVVILTSIGLVTDEKTRGTIYLMMTKPVKRWVFITSKYLATATIVTASTLLSYLACLYYTKVLFSDAMLKPSLEAIVLVVGYFLLVIAITLLASTLSGSQALAGGIAIGFLIVLSLLPYSLKSLAKYLPSALSGYETSLLTGGVSFAKAVPALAVTLSLAVVLVVTAVLVFRQQEL